MVYSQEDTSLYEKLVGETIKYGVLVTIFSDNKSVSKLKLTRELSRRRENTPKGSGMREMNIRRAWNLADFLINQGYVKPRPPYSRNYVLCPNFDR